MLTAEGSGIESHLHRVQEHLGDDTGVLGVVTHGYEADSLDQQDLRSMSVAGHIGLDFLFGLLHKILGIQDDVLALAINDDVRGEGQEDGLRILQEAVHEGVPGDLQGLESAAAPGQNLTDGRKDLGHFDGHFFTHAVRNRFHAGFQPVHDAAVDPVDFLRRVGAHEDTVVLQEDDLRFTAPGGLPGLNAVIHLLEEGIARIRIFDVKRVREKLGAGLRRLHGAHQAIHQRRVQMHHIGEAHTIMQGGFHGRTTSLGQAGGGQVFLDLSLPRCDVGAVRLLAHRIQLATVQDGETVLIDGGEGMSTGLHPQFLRILVGCVPATGDDVAGVGTIFPGNGNEILNHGHRSITSSMISSPASTLSRPT